MDNEKIFEIWAKTIPLSLLAMVFGVFNIFLFMTNMAKEDPMLLVLPVVGIVGALYVARRQRMIRIVAYNMVKENKDKDNES